MALGPVKAEGRVVGSSLPDTQGMPSAALSASFGEACYSVFSCTDDFRMPDPLAGIRHSPFYGVPRRAHTGCKCLVKTPFLKFSPACRLLPLVLLLAMEALLTMEANEAPRPSRSCDAHAREASQTP